MCASRCSRIIRALVMAILSAGPISGCATVSVRPVFNTYDKLAIWTRLTRTQEELFLPRYMRAFPNQILIERRDLESVLTEQDILPERLDEATRARIRRIYGVKAIVYPNYTPGSPSQLAIKVIDTENAAIVASVVVRGKDHRTDRGASDESLIRVAIDSLKNAADRAKQHP